MPASASSASTDSLITALRDRYREYIRERTSEKIAEREAKVPDLIKTQILDPAHPQRGGWGEVIDCNSRTLAWDGKSLTKLKWFAEVWDDRQSKHYRDPELAKRIDLGAAFYASVLNPAEPFPHNWWCWQIGFPHELAKICLLAEEAMSPATHAALLKAFRHLVDHIWDYHASANRMTVTTSVLGYALSARSPEYLERVKAWAEQGAEPVADVNANPQGFRRDGSYFFHGARVNLAYGAGHLVELARLSHLLAGTPWQIGGPGLGHVTRCLLDFVQWTMCGKKIDPFILDRNISTPETVAFDQLISGAMLETGLLLIEVGAARREELEDLCMRMLQAGVKPRTPVAESLAARYASRTAAPLSGARYYLDAEYAVAQRPGWMASIKMASWRTSAYAGINRLNRKGWHISDGQIILRTTGDEFDDSVFTTMDWERLTGITRADGFRLPHETHGHGWFATGATGADGITACCGLDFCIRRPDDQGEIAARKNWFLLQDAIVASGSNIWTTAAVELETIIRHVVLPPELEQAKFEEGEFEAEFIAGHDCIYVLPEKPRVRVFTEWREGSYADIGDAEKPPKAYRRRYWTALISHGRGPHPCWGDPKTDGRYTIAYLPGMTLDAAKAWWAARPFEILQQNTLAHRLRDRRRNQTMTVTQWKGAAIGP